MKQSKRKRAAKERVAPLKARKTQARARSRGRRSSPPIPGAILRPAPVTAAKAPQAPSESASPAPERLPYGTDLYAFAGLLGESFRARVDLLEAILGKAHFPSVGTFKENLIAQLLRNIIPNRFAVGTGFVLFPAAKGAKVTGPADDPMQYYSFVLSHQCDIIVYDVASVPVVFRDLDFVVVRPEAVRAVVEIKGRLSKTGLSSILENAATFAEKWKVWADSHAGGVLQVPRPKDPEIAALAWKVNGAPGRPTPNGTEAREAIAARFGPMFDGRAATSPPLFDHLFVYDEYIVGQSVDVFDDGRPGSSLKVLFGWKTTHGRWLKRGDNGLSSRREDKTIATLLAAVLGALEDPKLSGLPTGKYMGTPWRPRDDDVQPHPCSGTTHCGELKPPTPRQGEATSKLKKPRQRTS